MYECPPQFQVAIFNVSPRRTCPLTSLSCSVVLSFIIARCVQINQVTLLFTSTSQILSFYRNRLQTLAKTLHYLHSPCSTGFLQYSSRKPHHNVGRLSSSKHKMFVVTSTTIPLDFNEIAHTQKKNAALQTQRSSNRSLKLEDMILPMCADTICNTSAQYRRQVFDALHSLSHSGIRSTQKLVTSRYIWPEMNSEQCQRNKVNRHNKTSFQEFNTPQARFDRIRIDIVGPLPPSNGYAYMLTCIDRYTRLPETFPIQDITAEKHILKQQR